MVVVVVVTDINTVPWTRLCVTTATVLVSMTYE